jgi:hypothetical protein
VKVAERCDGRELSYREIPLEMDFHVFQDAREPASVEAVARSRQILCMACRCGVTVMKSGGESKRQRLDQKLSGRCFVTHLGQHDVSNLLQERVLKAGLIAYLGAAQHSFGCLFQRRERFRWQVDVKDLGNVMRNLEEVLFEPGRA